MSNIALCFERMLGHYLLSPEWTRPADGAENSNRYQTRLPDYYGRLALPGCTAVGLRVGCKRKVRVGLRI